jgi:hypothetical protein
MQPSSLSGMASYDANTKTATTGLSSHRPTITDSSKKHTMPSDTRVCSQSEPDYSITFGGRTSTMTSSGISSPVTNAKSDKCATITFPRLSQCLPHCFTKHTLTPCLCCGPVDSDILFKPAALYQRTWSFGLYKRRLAKPLAHSYSKKSYVDGACWRKS